MFINVLVGYDWFINCLFLILFSSITLKGEIMKTYMDKIRGEHPNFATVLEMMCDAVGAPYSIVNRNLKYKSWFQRYTWTEAQEVAFKKKLIDWIYNNSSARSEFNHLPKRKIDIDKWVCWFLFDYGWMIKE